MIGRGLRLCAAVLLCTAALAGPALAETRALLIGVSSYPALPAERQLQGPRNDVQRLREVLVARGVAPSRIQLLADGVPGAGAPTRDNILQALAHQAELARPGDTLVLHFAGHGSRQPDAAGRGWTPILLPADIGRWDGKAGRVERAIGGDELRVLIDRITARGSFVWGIFDACHAAGAVRGAPMAADADQALRLVPSTVLGVPATVAHDVGPIDAGPPPGDQAGPRPAPGARGLRTDSAAPGLTPDGRAASVPSARAALFYAAQGHEPTPELTLPRQLFWRERRGLFSDTVTRALQRAGRISYRQLGQFVLAEYAAMNGALATPLFSGDGLDRQVLGEADWPQAQWPLRLDPQGPWVEAGALSGLLPGAVLAMVAGPLDPPDLVLGHLTVTGAEAARARLAAVAHGGLPSPTAAALSPGRYLRLLRQPPAFSLRVAADTLSCAADCALPAALQQLREQGAVGVDLEWVGPRQTPDLLLRPAGDRLLLLPPAWQGADNAAIGASDAVAWLDLRRDGKAMDVAALAAGIGSALQRVGRARNLLALAARQATAPVADGLVVQLRRLQGRVPLGLLPTQAAVPVLQAGDRMALDLHNTGPQALDVTVLYLDAQHGVAALHPGARGPLNRLAPGDALTVDGLTVSAPPVGLEHVLVLARPAVAGAERADFSFLAQPSFSRPRGAVDDDTEALLDAAFAAYRSRGQAQPSFKDGALSMRLLTLDVRAARP